jgi:hypothetical protein
MTNRKTGTKPMIDPIAETPSPRAAKQSRHDEHKRQPRIEELSHGTPLVGEGIGRHDLPATSAREEKHPSSSPLWS